MKFLRNVDELAHSLSKSQARIFERSVKDGIPSKIFIKSYMLSYEVRDVDDLILTKAGITELEIYDVVSEKVKTRNGILYPLSIMHFMGYFYRMAAYLTGNTSKFLYQNIKPDFLARNYQTLHALDIEEAVKEAFQINHIEEIDKYELFKKIYKFSVSD